MNKTRDKHESTQQKPFQKSLRWSMVLGVGGILVGSAVLLINVTPSLWLQAQSAASLEAQKADLQQEIQQYQKDIVEEKKIFERYLGDKTRLLEQKQEELNRVSREVREREREINALNREVTIVEIKTSEIDNRNAALLASLREQARRLSAEIDAGIPFDKEQRKSALTAIINDSQSATVNVNEIFNRLVAFLNNEQAMASDSQVVRSIVSVGGEQRTVDLLRVGRVFFAIDIGEAVYVYAKTESGEFTLRDEAPVSFQEEQSIRELIAMVQGRLPPDLVPITLPDTEILKRTN